MILRQVQCDLTQKSLGIRSVVTLVIDLVTSLASANMHAGQEGEIHDQGPRLDDPEEITGIVITRDRRAMTDTAARDAHQLDIVVAAETVETETDSIAGIEDLTREAAAVRLTISDATASAGAHTGAEAALLPETGSAAMNAEGKILSKIKKCRSKNRLVVTLHQERDSRHL